MHVVSTRRKLEISQHVERKAIKHEEAIGNNLKSEKLGSRPKNSVKALPNLSVLPIALRPGDAAAGHLAINSGQKEEYH